MSCSSTLAVVSPPTAGVFRIARSSADPFSPPSWDYAHDDGTFGNRFDDPSAVFGRPSAERFRVVYCATQRAAAFGETVAHFRPSLTLLAALENVQDDESIEQALIGAVDPVSRIRGVISTDWRLRRCIGQTILDPNLCFVDLAAGKSLAYLRTMFASLAVELPLADVDLSSVTSQHRLLTQAFARHLYDRVDAHGHPCYAGIRYTSRLNGLWECWAIFDDRLRHRDGWPIAPEPITADDHDLVQVASIFNLTIQELPGHVARP